MNKPSQNSQPALSLFTRLANAVHIPKNSVKALLIKRLMFTGLILAIISSLAYSYISGSVIEEFYKKESTQATENLAALSELALLYESGENAQEAALATLNFPSIKHVAIIDRQNRIIFSEGDTNEAILTSLDEKSWVDNSDHEKISRIVAQNSDTWQIAAPVYTSTEYNFEPDVMLDAEEESSSYLGYVAVQVDASQVRTEKKNNFVKNMLIGLGYGLAFLLVVFFVLGKILKPMSALASLMEKSQDGNYPRSDIEINAAEEVKTISSAYNRMIATLEERDQSLRAQKELLETEVALRTSELIQARDAALEANNLKSEFLANVTHELRTPLQSILGYTELLSETLEDAGMEHCSTDVEKITGNASHLLELINSILDISKIEAGKMDVRIESTDVHALITKAAETVKPLVEKNGNRLEFDIRLSSNELFVDSKKVYQVLLNLLSNAAKFTNEGVIKISASDDRGILMLAVADSGIGMSSEQQRLIFEPFRQIDGSESRKFDGTGLGLSIVLRLTEILSGQVKLESEINKGSTFFIEIPLANEGNLYQSNAQ